MRRFPWEYVAAVLVVLAFLAFATFCIFLGRHADSYEPNGTEFTAVDSKFADKLMLCATRIHILEREVDMLKGRVEDMEIRMIHGFDYEDEKCRTESQGVNSSR